MPRLPTVLIALLLIVLIGWMTIWQSLTSAHTPRFTELNPMVANLGDLDPTFGKSGKVTAIFFSNSAFAYAVALQPDGRIIAAGGNSTTQGFSLARFHPNGSLDNSFGMAGKVATAFNSPDDFAYAQAVALQSDQKIVAAGLARNISGVNQCALARYLPNGSLDSGFGSSGRVRTSVAGPDDQIRAISIQPDGRIVAAGSGNGDFIIVRYNSDGSLDGSFGSAGKIVFDFDGLDDSAQAVAIQADGKIIVAGGITIVEPPFFRKRFGLLKYNSNGTLDTSFGTGGKVITSFSTNPFLDAKALALTVQGDSKIIVGGRSAGPQGGEDYALARYNSDGSLDTSFGSSGTVTTDFANLGNEEIRALALQPDGKILAAGFTDSRTSNQLFALARYNPSGTLDSTFGVGGKVSTSFFAGGFHCGAYSMVIQSDGNIIAAGFAFFTTGNHMALARYIGDAPISPTPTPTPTPTPNPSPTPTPAPIELFLADPSVLPNQVAAVNSVLMLKDPFTIFDPRNMLRLAIDPNTRVTVFVRNLQLSQGELPSTVVVHLVSTFGIETHEIPAEDVRQVGNLALTQVTFRLPDNLGDDDWRITVRAHGQETNPGVIRIR